MKANAIIRINFSSEKRLKIVLEALKPETGSLSTRRSEVKIKSKGSSLILNFKARDTSALRAAINSYLWLIGMLIDVVKIMRDTAHYEDCETR